MNRLSYSPPRSPGCSFSSAKPHVRVGPVGQAGSSVVNDAVGNLKHMEEPQQGPWI